MIFFGTSRNVNRPPTIIHHNQVAVRVMQDIAEFGNRIFFIVLLSFPWMLLVYIILVILYIEHYHRYIKIFDSSQYTFTHILNNFIVQSLSARKGGYSSW